MGAAGVAAVGDFVVDVDFGQAEGAMDLAADLEDRAEHARVADDHAQAHVEAFAGGVGVDDRFEDGGRAGVAAVEAEGFTLFGAWLADVVRAAGGEESAGPSAEPLVEPAW